MVALPLVPDSGLTLLVPQTRLAMLENDAWWTQWGVNPPRAPARLLAAAGLPFEAVPVMERHGKTALYIITWPPAALPTPLGLLRTITSSLVPDDADRSWPLAPRR